MLSASVMASVSTARAIAFGCPKVGLATMAPSFTMVGLPVIHLPAAGMSDRPMTVMIEPVTTGGKNRMTCEKNGTISRATMPAAMMAP